MAWVGYRNILFGPVTVVIAVAASFACAYVVAVRHSTVVLADRHIVRVLHNRHAID